MIKVDIKLPNISMSVMKKKFQTNPLDHLDHSLQGDILKLEALEKKKKNKHKARNETSSSFRWSNSLVEVELPDQVFIIIHFRLLPSSYCQVVQVLKSLTLIPFWAILGHHFLGTWVRSNNICVELCLHNVIHMPLYLLFVSWIDKVIGYCGVS